MQGVEHHHLIMYTAYRHRYSMIIIIRRRCPPALYGIGRSFGVSNPLIKSQIHAPIVWGDSYLNAALTPSIMNLGSLKLTPHPMLIIFGKSARW